MKLIILLTFLVSLTSCGQKKVKADFAVDFSSLATALGIDDFKGGMILYGVSHTGDSFTRILNNPHFSSEIPEAIWDFHVVAWAGSGTAGTVEYFSGEVACGNHLGVNLKDSDQIVNINIANSTCSDYGKVTGAKFVHVPTVFQEGSVGGCDIADPTAAGSNCTQVYVFSVKASVLSLNNFSGNITHLGAPVSSLCINVSGGEKVNYPLANLPGHHSIGAVEVFEGSDSCGGGGTSVPSKVRLIGKSKIHKVSNNLFNILF